MDVFKQLTAALAERYSIVREIGSGGMATVYLAEDVRHHRKVAIKVLHPELSAQLGTERFLKEIELTANLQHPHILPLFDSGSVEGVLYYVMPYVEGETLRTRLMRERQLPVVDALRLAVEVAEALEYAHKRGVIHRDIKPENILLHDGHSLVADFGIALAVQQAGGERMTQTGLSLGTPQYMSPEQAMGERTIDERADVYALAVVTYEMLAGEPPFTGSSAQAIVAKVLTERPRSLSSVRHTISADVDAAILTALEKLPADRFKSTAEFAAKLRGHTLSGAPSASPAGARPWRPVGAAAALVAAAILVAAAFASGRLNVGRTPQTERFGRTVRVTWEQGLEILPAVSPDGRYVVYAAGQAASMRIFVRQVSGGRASPLTDDTLDVQTNPSWSPDGQRILFLTRGGVFSAPSSGGVARPEIPAQHQGEIVSAAWNSGATAIAYVIGDSLYSRTVDNVVRLVTRIVEPSACRWSPNSELIACVSGNRFYGSVGLFFGNLSPSRVVVVRVSDGTVATVTDSVSLNQSPVWSVDGRYLDIVSNRDGVNDIYRRPIARDGTVQGVAKRVTTGLGAHSISRSANGARVAYSVFSGTSNVWKVPIPTHPPVSASTAVQVTSGSQIIEGPALSSDEQWLLYDSNASGMSDIYRMRLPAGPPERLVSDATDSFTPHFSPDGREIAFHSWRSGSRDVYVMPLDGGPTQRVSWTTGQEARPVWSPDGRALAFNEYRMPGAIWIARRNADGAWQKPVRRLPFGYWPMWSSDGRFISFAQRFTGGSLLIVPVDSGPPRVLVDSKTTGMQVGESFWSRDGRTVYFKNYDTKGSASIWSIPAAGGARTLLVRFDDPAHPSYRPNWAIGKDYIYFPIDDRQSDIRVMDVLRP